MFYYFSESEQEFLSQKQERSLKNVTPGSVPEMIMVEVYADHDLFETGSNPVLQSFRAIPFRMLYQLDKIIQLLFDSA